MTDPSGDNKRYYFYRDQLIALAIGFTIASVIIYVLGIMTGRYLERGTATSYPEATVKIPIAPPQSESAPEAWSAVTPSGGPASIPDSAAGPAIEAAKESRVKEKIDKAESSKTPPVKKAAKSAPQLSATKSADEKPTPAARREQREDTEAVKKEPAERLWAVQIKSSPDKKFADTWANRLKAKGYDAFVVEGDVKGQTWYRVRVGHFAARQEAEALRVALESKEGLSGGFLTLDKGADSGSKKE